MSATLTPPQVERLMNLQCPSCGSGAGKGGAPLPVQVKPTGDLVCSACRTVFKMAWRAVPPSPPST
jgi:hypothetical protein